MNSAQTIKEHRTEAAARTLQRRKCEKKEKTDKGDEQKAVSQFVIKLFVHKS